MLLWILESPVKADIKIKEWRTSIANPIVKRIPPWISPNHLSLARCLSIVLIIPPTILGRYGVAFSIFLVASLLDFFDGELARSRQQESDLGKLLDPVGDKLIFLSTLIALVYTVNPEPISRGLMWFLIGLEFGSASLALARSALIFFWKVEVPLGSNRFGQWKFTCEAVGILIFLLNPRDYAFQLAASFLLKAALVLLILSISYHILLAARGINFRKQKQQKRHIA